MYLLHFIPIKKIFTLFFLLCGLLGEVLAQNSQKIDSLKKVLKKANQKERYDVEFSLFSEYFSYDYDEAVYHVSQALDQALINGDSVAIVNSANGKGLLLKQHGDAREAIKLFEFALKIAKQNDYKKMIKFLLNNLALSYTLRADYDKALEYNFESLKIREAEGDPQSISVALNNIGLVYHELRDYENALMYYEKSYHEKIEHKVKYDLERCLINLGLVLNAMGRFDLAEAKLQEAFTLCDSVECSPDILVEANQALGIALLNDHKLPQAETYFTESLQKSQKLELPEFTSSDFNWLARLRYNQGRLKEALEFLDKSQEVATKASIRKQILDNFLYYSMIYSELDDFKKASDYKDLYIKLYGEIFNAELIKNISRTQTAYEERENIKTIGLNEAIITQQRILNSLLIAVILLTSALGIVIYRNYKKIKVVNDALARAKGIIEIQNKRLDHEIKEKTRELVDTNETLVKVNDELDNFIYKTSHDIRGPLASLKGIVNLALMDVQDEKAQDYLSKLDVTAEKLNTVLLRLLIVNRINHTELKPEVIHFEPIIQEILTLEIKKGVPSKIKIDYEVAPDVQIMSDKEMVSIVLENLIDNAIKFHNESERTESFVKIKVTAEYGNVVVRIKDNGVGISEMDREKIFQMFVRASERSATGGIGLYLAKLATEKLGGDIRLISGNEKITEFIVQFPNDLQVVIDKRIEDRRKLEEEKSQMEGKKKTVTTPDKGLNKFA